MTVSGRCALAGTDLLDVGHFQGDKITLLGEERDNIERTQSADRF